jgi:hypothetical protein
MTFVELFRTHFLHGLETVQKACRTMCWGVCVRLFSMVCGQG